MKRFLSWLTLIGCYIAFILVISLDMELLAFISKLYNQLSAFLKLIVLFIGGSSILGLTIAPLLYGIPITYHASEAVCPSRKGDRYVVMGVIIALTFVLNLISGFALDDLLYTIYGIALIFYGRSKSSK